MEEVEVLEEVLVEEVEVEVLEEVLVGEVLVEVEVEVCWSACTRVLE